MGLVDTAIGAVAAGRPGGVDDLGVDEGDGAPPGAEQDHRRATAGDPDRDPAPAGRPAILAVVYQDKAAVLRRLALGMTRDPGVADDLVQDAFARTLRARRAPEQADQLFFYLVRVVVNLTRSHRARAARRGASAGGPGPGSAPAADAGPDDELAQAVAGLPRRQREVLFLRFWLDLSVDQTAATLGISPGAVKTHASRAVDRLRTRLAAEVPAEPSADGGGGTHG